MPLSASDGPKDDDFLPEEQLFRRYCNDDVSGADVLPGRLQFPGTSVNREKYSERPEDVLHRDCCDGTDPKETGILVARVSDVVNDHVEVSGTGKRFLMRVSHEPEKTCLPHSVVWCLEEGAEAPPRRLPDKVRHAFRAVLARNLRVWLEARE